MNSTRGLKTLTERITIKPGSINIKLNQAWLAKRLNIDINKSPEFIETVLSKSASFPSNYLRQNCKRKLLPQKALNPVIPTVSMETDNA